MLFNSAIFGVFFLCVLSLYWALGARRPQNVLLLVASYVFYGAWSWKFLLLLLASTSFDYISGRLIQQISDQRKRRIVFMVAVTASLALLVVFKYLGFFTRELVALLESLGFRANVRVIELVLPVGISFYTFQSLGYVVDVYRGKIQAERSLLSYALYVAFFPQLVAGPIERAGHMLPQIKHDREWNRGAFESGLQLAVWGLFKKIVIADNLAPYVNVVYGEPTAYAGWGITTATVFFAFQIYADFSGYTDTARGIARMLGFELIRNFNYPYLSRTPVEFWRRWHMSLSQWFQDYLYFPLALRAMRTGGWGSRYWPHIVSMGLIGLWHGANWTFFAFGLYWGFALVTYLYVVERFSGPSVTASNLGDSGIYAKARAALAIGLMFVVVCIGWTFFRAPTIGDAWYLLTHVFSTQGATEVRRVDVITAPVLWALIGMLLFVEWLHRNRRMLGANIATRPVWQGDGWQGVACRYVMLVAILFSYMIAQEGSVQPFIYFQF